MEDKIIKADLESILDQTYGLWNELRGQRLFLTGGTGFFGKWLLENFLAVHQTFGLNAEVTVLTRDPVKFMRNSPHLCLTKAIKFHRGDVKNFSFPEGSFSHIIHAAATSATETFNREPPLQKFLTVVEGTHRVLDFAAGCCAKKLLFTSSGAVYGQPPAGMGHVPETYNGAPDPAGPKSVWAESKRAAELLCAVYGRQYNFEAKIARCFTFIGPYLPLDIHYAAGNFIRDALKGGPIMVDGDGTPRRSYMYPTDLVVWLLTILVKGQSGTPYNVGSRHDVSIAELAQTVAKVANRNIEVKIAKAPAPNAPLDRYVPDTTRAQAELGLKETLDLEQSIRRTINYHKTSC